MKIYAVATVMLNRKQTSTVCVVISILPFGAWEKGRFKQVWQLRNTKAIQGNLTITMTLERKPS